MSINKLLLKTAGILSINALISCLFLCVWQIFKIPTTPILITAFLFVIAFNFFLRKIGVFKKSDDTINEKLFIEFTENIKEVFWRATPDLTKILYVSAPYDEIWGKSRESLYINSNEWSESVIPADRERVLNTLLSLTEKGVTNVSFEFRIQRPNGDIRELYTRAFKYLDADGELINILGITSDATNYNREEQSKKIHREIENILELGHSLAMIVPYILNIICHTCKWDFGEMWLVDKEANLLRSISIWDNSNSYTPSDFDTKSQAITFESGVTVPGQVWQHGRLIWIGDLSNTELIRRKEADQQGFHSVIALPIFMNNSVIGVLDFFSNEIKKPDEITTNILESTTQQISLFISKKHTEDEVIYASRHDAQTSLLNRSALKDNIRKVLAASTKPVAIILLEIEKLKLITSAIGAEDNDILLKMVVDRLNKIITGPAEQLGRYETNVFSYYLPFVSIEEVTDFCEKILKIFSLPFIINHQNVHLSVNVGLTTNSESGSEISTLFKHANFALDAAIKMGKNNFSFFSAEFPNVAHDRLVLEASLRHALNNNELCLYYQPKISLKTGEICGAEALVRWRHPEKGLIPPCEFIHLAEETGLIIQLDEWVLREVFKLIKYDCPMDTKGKGIIAVNISPQHFKSKNDIITFLKSLLHEYEISPNLVEIEITESILLDESDYDLNAISELIKMGFDISLDDFGTGFNSLKYLLRVPVHTVKIDKSFIDGIPNSKVNKAIVKAIIVLCQSLDKKVIAEGVESLEQAQFLKKEGCDEIQGYYFSKPVPIEDFKKLISEHKALTF